MWAASTGRQLGGEAGQDVDHAAGEVGRRQDLAQRDRRQRPRCSLASTTAVLPVTTTGATTETRPEQLDSCGATTATTPVGSGHREVEVRARDRVGRSVHLRQLVRPTGVPDPPVDGRVHDGSAWRVTPSARHLGHELVAAALHHLGDPVEHLPPVVRRGADQPGRTPRAATTASRRPCGRHARRWRGTARAVGDLVGPAALRAGERPADEQLVGLADVAPSVDSCATSRYGRARAGRPRGRTRTPCSRRTGSPGRTG
jgi:hypothetical protein